MYIIIDIISMNISLGEALKNTFNNRGQHLWETGTSKNKGGILKNGNDVFSRLEQRKDFNKSYADAFKKR